MNIQFYSISCGIIGVVTFFIEASEELRDILIYGKYIYKRNEKIIKFIVS